MQQFIKELQELMKKYGCTSICTNNKTKVDFHFQDTVEDEEWTKSYDLITQFDDYESL